MSREWAGHWDAPATTRWSECVVFASTSMIATQVRSPFMNAFYLLQFRVALFTLLPVVLVLHMCPQMETQTRVGHPHLALFVYANG